MKPRQLTWKCSKGHVHRSNKHGGICRECIKAVKAGKHTILCACCCHDVLD